MVDNQNNTINMPPPPQTPKKRGCGFWALIGVGGIIGLGVIGSLLPEPTPEQKAKMAVEAAETAKAEGAKQQQDAAAERAKATKVTAGELFTAYQGNEMAAQQAFGDRLLEVSGTVSGVDLDFSDNPVVKLRTSNQFMDVSVRLTDETQSAAAGYKNGQKIIVLCKKISEIASMPQLDECVPVE
jgi:hypothetical protein